MTRLAALALGLVTLQSGCTVTAVSASDDPRPNNSCSQPEECGGGATCHDGLCQTLNGVIESLLLTASPPSDSSLPHLTFVTQLADVPTAGGSREIELPSPTQIAGSLLLPVGMSCYPAFPIDADSVMPAATDKTLPAVVSVGLRQRLLGISQQVYYAKTGGIDGPGYGFDLKVPAGEYDVYLVPPTVQANPNCVVPPQLYRDFPIGIGDDAAASSTIKFRLSPISSLKLSLTWPLSSPSLDGWIADIVEPSSGNAISTQVVLGNAIAHGEQSQEYSVPLAYSTVIRYGNQSLDPAGDLVRFRPPEGAVAPTIYLDRSAIGLLGENPGDVIHLTAFSRLPGKVDVHGQLLRQSSGSSVAGVVTLVSTQIYGVDPGVFASYQTTVRAKADGLIDVTLPPGQYRVHGEPLVSGDSDSVSAAETVWDVPADLPLQFGKVLELPAMFALAGHSRFVGAVVSAVPSLENASTFEQAFGGAPFSPRASSGLVDDQGAFTVPIDPGRFDISVQAPEELGYAWYVRPGVQAGDRDFELGTVQQPRPSVLSGSVTLALPSGTQPLASSAIRAYVYLNKDFAYTRDPEQATSVVQVAETRSDAQGKFRLLLPATIAASK